MISTKSKTALNSSKYHSGGEVLQSHRTSKIMNEATMAIYISEKYKIIPW